MSENILRTIINNVELKTKKIEELTTLIDSLSVLRQEMSNCADKIWSDSGKVISLCLELLNEQSTN